MKQSTFILIIGIFAIAKLSQGIEVETAQNPIFGNEIKITPAHMKHLKKLVYVLSEPQYHQKVNTQLTDLEKLLSHIEGAKDAAELIRAQRDLKDIIKKIKSFLDKIFNKGKGKGKSSKPDKPKNN